MWWLKILGIIVLVFLVFFMFLVLMQIEYASQINFHRIQHPEFYGSRPFSCFPNQSEQSNHLKTAIQRGKKLARSKKIVICGLARDLVKILPQTRVKLEHMGQQFRDYRIVCFENDSSDGTRNMLKQWMHENPKFILLDCQHLNVPDCRFKSQRGYDLGFLSKQRINKMAFYREQYLQYVKQHLSDFDYLLVTDFDLDGNHCLDGLFHCLSYDEHTWDAMFINGLVQLIGTFGHVTMTYDGLAYIDLHDDFQHGKSIDTMNKMLKCLQHYFRMIWNIWHSGGKLVPVKAAFNGYGLYQMKSILPSSCSYLGNELCEHNNLAKSMVKLGGKLYINPLWRGYFNYHSTGPGGPWEILSPIFF